MSMGSDTIISSVKSSCFTPVCFVPAPAMSDRNCPKIWCLRQEDRWGVAGRSVDRSGGGGKTHDNAYAHRTRHVSPSYNAGTETTQWYPEMIRRLTLHFTNHDTYRYSDRYYSTIYYHRTTGSNRNSMVVTRSPPCVRVPRPIRRGSTPGGSRHDYTQKCGQQC